MQEIFVNSVGYILGILVVLVVSGIFLKPIKFALKLVANSVVGAVILWIINFVGKGAGIHIGLNPITAVAVGIFGLPGVIAILLLQIFY